MDPIRIVPGSQGAGDVERPANGAVGGGADRQGFGALLADSLAQVNRLQHEADQAITELATGKSTTLHDTMLALEKADLSFRLMMQVRNKIVEAYQEVIRMQV